MSAANFEKTLQELEKIIKTMEQGDASLEESMKLFEKGTELAQRCQGILEKAEQKVQALSQKNGEEQLEDLSQETQADKSRNQKSGKDAAGNDSFDDDMPF